MVDSKEETGPFGIGKDMEWDWDFYVKPGATPNDEQFSLAVQLANLGGRIRETGRNNQSEDFMQSVVGLFSAGLVNKVTGDLTHYKTQANDLSKRFYTEYLTGLVQKSLVWPILAISSIFALLVGLNVTYSRWSPLVPELPNASVYMIWLITGLLAGRVIYFSLTYLEAISSIEQFNLALWQSKRFYINVIFDLFVAIVAFALFSSGFLVITIGSTDGAPGSGISSLSVTDNAMISFGFGILVGVVRTEFMKKVRNVASGGLG